MALSGYTKSAGRKNGGIRILALINQSDVLGATYHLRSQGYTEIRLREGCRFSVYEFPEDQAEYIEQVSFSQGALVVRHELRFMLEKMGDEISPIISELNQSSLTGLIGIVVTPNGDSFVVGYSEEFRAEQPLRVRSITGRTGKGLSDPTYELITLGSEDVSKAKPYKGNLAAILPS